MDLSNTPVTATRHDGWTPARRAQFLDRLAQNGNVLAARALVGLSREAAYKLRRREPLFARASQPGGRGRRRTARAGRSAPQDPVNPVRSVRSVNFGPGVAP